MNSQGIRNGAIGETATTARFLQREFEILDPVAVILLGLAVARWFSEREGWDRKRWKMRDWTEKAGPLTCFGKERYITAWAHTAGASFWTKGKAKWPVYAKQMALYLPAL